MRLVKPGETLFSCSGACCYSVCRLCFVSFVKPARVRPGKLPIIEWRSLSGPVGHVGEGAFGELSAMTWAATGSGEATPVCLKRARSTGANCLTRIGHGYSCTDARSVVDCFNNELDAFGSLARRPHPHIVAVIGQCIDAPDGDVRLVMKLYELGSLRSYLDRVRPEVLQ
jgi:hypothetical protein